MKRLLRWTRVIVVAAATTVTCVTALAVVAPAVLPIQFLYVQSGSMEPNMGVGALVMARPADASELGKGDVIVFSPGGKGAQVMHRIVRREATPQGEVFVTKGDANDAEDPWLVPAAGSGWRIERSVPKVGYALGFARDPRASMVLLSTAGGWLMFGLLRRIWRSPAPAPSAA